MRRMKSFGRYKPYLTLIILVAGLLLAACTPGGPGSAETPPAQPGETATEIPGETPVVPTPFETEILPPAAVLAAQQTLADQLGIPASEVTIREIEQVQWPNACLGAPQPGEMCAEVVTDGFRAVFEVGGQTYEYHTDLDGSQIRPLTAVAEPEGEGDLPEAVLRARQVLAQQLGVNLDEIQVVRFEAVEWPDSCLGVKEQGQVCAQVVTPGYRVIFEAEGKQYEFHTDEEGGAVILAMAPLPQITGTVLTWEQTVDGACNHLEIGEEGAAAGPCGGDLVEGQLPAERQEQLMQLLSRYAPFTGETRAGGVDFKGQGEEEASEAEQRSIAEWARLVAMEVESGRSDPSRGLAFSWHREGGFAGFCDNLEVYAGGWAYPSTCKGGSSQNLGSFRLTAEQLEQMYAWMDQFQGFEYEQADPAVADAMTVRLAFSGNGTEEATRQQQEQIALFAQGLFNEAPR